MNDPSKCFSSDLFAICLCFGLFFKVHCFDFLSICNKNSALFLPCGSPATICQVVKYKKSILFCPSLKLLQPWPLQNPRQFQLWANLHQKAIWLNKVKLCITKSFLYLVAIQFQPWWRKLILMVRSDYSTATQLLARWSLIEIIFRSKSIEKNGGYNKRENLSKPASQKYLLNFRQSCRRQ